MIYQLSTDETLEINTIVLDLNGTLSVNGVIPSEIPGLLSQLKKLDVRLILLSGDIRGNAQKLADDLGMELVVAKNAHEKEKAILQLEPETCAAVGNARIDIGAFKHAKLSIATLQAEGIHVDILKYVDILVPSVADALNLFINKKSLLATMKN